MFSKKVEKYLGCANLLLHHPFKKDICFKNFMIMDEQYVMDQGPS